MQMALTISHGSRPVYYLFQCVSILSTSMVIVMFVNMKQYSSTRDGWLCEHSCPGLCGQKRHPSLFHAKCLARVAPMLLHTKLKFADILLDSFKRNDVVSLGGQHKHSWIALQGKLFQTKIAAEQIYSNMVSCFPTTGTSVKVCNTRFHLIMSSECCLVTLPNFQGTDVYTYGEVLGE